MENVREGRMKVRIEQIGNSRGIRLPHTLLPEARVGDIVELQIKHGHILAHKATRPRSGWAEAARRMRALGEDRLLDASASTRFDKKNWMWE